MNVDNFLAYKHSAFGLPVAKPRQNQSGSFVCKTLKKIKKDMLETDFPVSQKDNLPIFLLKYQNYFCLLLNKEHGRQESLRNFVGKEIKISGFPYNLNRLEKFSSSPLP